MALLTDEELIPFILQELGDKDKVILRKSDDRQAFLEYLDYACTTKVNKPFPRETDRIDMYWLPIAYALMERFVTPEMIA